MGKALLQQGMALAAFGWPLLAAGWTLDAPLQAPLPASSASTVRSLSWDTQGGFLIELQLGDGSREVLHLDATERLLARRTAQGDGDPQDSIYPLAATGSLRADGGRQTGCLTRLATDGQVQWHSFDSTAALYCGDSVATPSGATWVIEGSSLGNTVARIDPAGRWVLGRAEIGSLDPSPSALAPTGDEGVYVAGYRSNGAVVARLAADGSTLWRTELSLAQAGLDCRGYTLQARDFGVRATCTPWAPGLSEYWDLSDNGAVLGSAQLNHPFGGHDFDQPPSTDRHPEVATSSDSVTRFDADRQRLWTYTLPLAADDSRRVLKAFLVDAAGELRLISEHFDASLQRTVHELHALRLDGSLRLQQELATDPATTRFHPLPDGSFMLASDPARRIDANGQLVSVQRDWLDGSQADIGPVAAIVGSEDRLVVGRHGDSLTLQAYQADGHLKWMQPVSGTDSAFNKLAASASAVCWRSALRLEQGYPLQCFDRENGEPLTSLYLGEESVTERRWSLLAGHTLALIDGTQLRFVSLLDGSEARAPEALQQDGHRLSGDHGSDRIMLVRGSQNKVMWLDQPQTETLELEQRRSQFLLLPDGLFSTLSTQLPLRWERRADGGSVDFATELAFERFLLHREGDRFVLLQYDDARAWLLALDIASGELLWRQDLPWRIDGLRVNSDHSLAGGVLAEADQGYVALATSTDLQLLRFSLATGELQEERAEPCGSLRCRYWLASEDRDGTSIPLLVERRYAPAGQRVASLALERATAFASAVPANQAALAGAWYNPAHRGQGFVLSYIPESQTLFMPWFTYDANTFVDANDEAELRWYSLQGQVDGASAIVQLDLLRNQAGEFGQPPATTAEVVGSAQLRFDGCDRASLRYRFDAGVEQGREGVIPLQRLGPRVRDCTVADGSVSPAPLAVEPMAGFDIDQSGAWFDPASSGQGLMIEVVPASPDQDGLLFATWFTYDQASLADDPFAQDWFALQADLREAADGRVVAPIYRSLGGVLDYRGTPHLFRVGEAELQFAGCDSLRLRYRFDDNELARRHRNVEGEQTLLRIGGCSVP